MCRRAKIKTRDSPAKSSDLSGHSEGHVHESLEQTNMHIRIILTLNT